MTTPHIKASKDHFAPRVLFPGDPLRAKMIANKFLKNATQVNDVRGMLGYTGTYQGRDISIMGSGMGVPSASIYAKELYTHFGVKEIIRIGSAGGIQDDLKLRDVVIAAGASTDSGVNRTRLLGYDFAAIASFHLLKGAADVAAKKSKDVDVHVGNVFTSDLFYVPDFSVFETLKKMGILAVEMECAGIYGVAAECGTSALGIMTVSDHVLKGESLPAEERQETFLDMVDIALNIE